MKCPELSIDEIVLIPGFSSIRYDTRKVALSWVTWGTKDINPHDGLRGWGARDKLKPLRMKNEELAGGIRDALILVVHGNMV